MSHTTPTRHLTSLVLAGLLVASLSACSSSGDKAATTTAATPTSAASTTAGASGGVSATAGGSSSGGATVHVADSRLGKIFVDSSGKTLYAFNDDTALTSKCNGGCSSNWPPLTSDTNPTGEGAVGLVTIVTITRDDGSKQVKIKTHPVYRFASDSTPGDTNGQGVGGKWHALDASGDPVAG